MTATDTRKPVTKIPYFGKLKGYALVAKPSTISGESQLSFSADHSKHNHLPLPVISLAWNIAHCSVSPQKPCPSRLLLRTSASC